MHVEVDINHSISIDKPYQSALSPDGGSEMGEPFVSLHKDGLLAYWTSLSGPCKTGTGQEQNCRECKLYLQ